jgi:hypothetical protein
MKILFAAVIALGFIAPAFAGQHCTTFCRTDGSGICYTDCN